MKFDLVKNFDISTAFKGMLGKGKRVTLLSGDWKKQYAVAAVSINGIKAMAEVHKNSADVWRVLSGEATFILGGKLVKPQKVGIGELVSKTISGGKRIKVAGGDIINIPPGVPHQIESINKKVKLLIFKVNFSI